MSKKIILCLFPALLFLVPKISVGENSYQSERIKDFAVEIKIDESSKINISEKITYDFGINERHGIFRFVPIKYKARGGKFNYRLSSVSVTDENGNPQPFTATHEGGNWKAKIGDPDRLITGTHTYIINYSIGRAVNFFDDHDELYWNVTGNEWPVLIEKASTRIYLPPHQKVGSGGLPKDTEEEKIMLECFTGVYGSREKNCQFKVESNHAVSFQTTQALNPDEGLTIVFGWPKGIVEEPSFKRDLSYILSDNWTLFIPLGVFLFMLILWYKRGREPKGKGTIIPEYEAPDNLIPAELATLLDMKVKSRAISATLIDLAHRGFLKIKKIPRKGIFGKEDFELALIKPIEETENEFERKLLDYIFYTGSVRKTSDLKNKFYKVLPELKKIIMNKLIKEDYFRGNPLNVFILYLILGLLIFFAGIFVLGWWPYLGFSLFLSGSIVIIFSFFMSQRTKKGAILAEKILGFKDFLSVTEKDRLKFFNPPTKTPELFEKFLSYAMVLGVEKEWANQFADIYKEPPQWYSDPSMTTFSTASFANSVAGFSSNASGAMASAPSGGSGFGGGGGSGGGGGGGGGGSW